MFHKHMSDKVFFFGGGLLDFKVGGSDPPLPLPSAGKKIMDPRLHVSCVLWSSGHCFTLTVSSQIFIDVRN